MSFVSCVGLVIPPPPPIGPDQNINTITTHAGLHNVGILEKVFKFFWQNSDLNKNLYFENISMNIKATDIIFLSWTNHIMEHFLGFFGGASTFDPKIALSYAQDNIGVKRSCSPKKSLEIPKLLFATHRTI